MKTCTTPLELGDLRYVIGTTCTWHGPIADAGLRVQKTADVGKSEVQRSDLPPCCPHCGGALMEAPSEAEFWAWVQPQKRSVRDVETMLRWSVGRCFPDFYTLENAWRQTQDCAQ